MSQRICDVPALVPVALAMLLHAACPGCQSSSEGSLKQALADYDAQRFATAQKNAAATMQATTGVQRQEAAYLAGMSAWQLGDVDDAERFLLAASGSTDRQVAGKAQVMLGMVRNRQGRYLEAGSHFKEASGALKGAQAKTAAHHAALAYADGGDAVSARIMAAMAGTSIATGAPAGEPGGFALQVGAYHERKHAERAASQANALAEPAGLSAAQIIQTRDHRGRTLYLVQFGRFRSRTAAAAARQRLGRLEYIVATAEEAQGG